MDPIGIFLLFFWWTFILMFAARKLDMWLITRDKKRDQLEEVFTDQYWHDDWNRSFVALGGQPVLTEVQQAKEAKRLEARRLGIVPERQEAAQQFFDHAYGGCLFCYVTPDKDDPERCTMTLHSSCPDYKVLLPVIRKIVDGGFKVSRCPECHKYSTRPGSCHACAAKAEQEKTKLKEQLCVACGMRMYGDGRPAFCRSCRDIARKNLATRGKYVTHNETCYCNACSAAWNEYHDAVR